jgi:hypothetical protein
MGADAHTFKDPAAIMPEDLRGQAKKSGALRRAREIRRPEDLPKLIFPYLTGGKSVGNTWALLCMGEGCHLAGKAVYTRTRDGAGWLRRLCENPCRESRIPVEKPGRLEGR